MRIHREASEAFPAMVPAGTRCCLCGSPFDFGPVEYTVEIGVEFDGDLCSSCADADPQELKRRMLRWAGMLRSMAEELEDLAGASA